MAKKQIKKKAKKNTRILLFLGSTFIISYFLFVLFNNQFNNIVKNKRDMFLAGNTSYVALYDEKFMKTTSIPRGTKVIIDEDNKIEDTDKNIYYKIIINDEKHYIMKNNLVNDEKKIVMEQYVYVRTPINLLSTTEEGKILTLAKKGDKLEVVGYDKIDNEGNVNIYEVRLNNITGNIYARYTVLDKDTALLNYQPEKYYNVHSKRGNSYGGGHAGNLDYYPVDKPVFKDNVMPDPVYALYLNSSRSIIANVDEYINLAKETKINAFVVDIKDNEAPGYKSPVMKQYSKTNYDRANNSFENYKNAIKKLRDEGFYVIGRITVFKDKYYALDHPEYAIGNNSTKGLYLHQGTYWPSPYQRTVWEFNVDLAKEAVREMGFNEIQFDYVRFPDRTLTDERSGLLNFKNTYKEEKAQAIQRFVRYACDELHKLNVYVSVDVFGESAHNYVTAYGQYWAAISNVVDVISAMPYPDHFSRYEYGFKEPVWSVPYDLLKYWGSNYAMKKQQEIPSPAKARTWIQAYDTIREPYITYNASAVEEQIRALFDAGLIDGYMTWKGNSSLSKYRAQIEAYKKNYK